MRPSLHLPSREQRLKGRVRSVARRTTPHPPAPASASASASASMDVAAHKVREAGGPIDKASYVCLCGLAFAAAVSMAAALVFGLAPAIECFRPDLISTLRAGGRGWLGRFHRRAGAALVVSEIALGFVLVTCAALTARTLSKMEQVRPGFEPRHLLTFHLPVGYSPAARRASSLSRKIFGALRTSRGEIARRRASSLPSSLSKKVFGALPRASQCWDGSQAKCDPASSRESY